jgi:predicted NBD/HSP70 family sugar kinase
MDQTAKPKLLRKINRGLILKQIRNRQLITKTILCKLTNLSAPTVNDIVNSLVKKGLIIEVGRGNSTAEGGKRPLLLKFNPDAFYLVGVMIGLSKIRCGITNLAGTIIFEDIINTNKDSGPGKIIYNLINEIKTVIKKSGIDNKKILGIGIGVPGVADFETGVVEVLPLFKNWQNIPLKEYIEKEFGVLVVIDNENRMRAVGEKWFGIAKNVKNFITLITGDGIGGGVVINNEVIRGFNHICGEIGHMKIIDDGPICSCGSRGCFENLLNTKRFNQYIDDFISKKDYINSELLKKRKDNQDNQNTFEELFDFYKKGDALAVEVVNKIIYWFAKGISNLICTYDPELIVIHGKYLNLDRSFFKKVEEAAVKDIFPKLNKVIKIKKSVIGHDIGIVGSSSLVLEIADI